MTNHVVVTRHWSGPCTESFTGPPLATPSSCKADAVAMSRALDELAYPFTSREDWLRYVELLRRETIEACAKVLDDLIERDRAPLLHAFSPDRAGIAELIRATKTGGSNG